MLVENAFLEVTFSSTDRPFTVVCSVTCTLNGNETGGDLTAFIVQIKLFLC